MSDTVKEEGFWRQREDEQSPLPWPVADPAWTHRQRFLTNLDTLEAVSLYMDYMGFSPCRLCGKDNGASEFKSADWVWPQGYRHYIAEHDVRPSPSFERFILDAG